VLIVFGDEVVAPDDEPVQVPEVDAVGHGKALTGGQANILLLLDQLVAPNLYGAGRAPSLAPQVIVEVTVK